MAKKGKKTKKVKRAVRENNPLTAKQAVWEESEARSFGAPFPDDVYKGRIENAIIETSRNGRLQVRWDLLSTEGKLEGRQCRKYNGLETKDNMDWFKGDLSTLGLAIPDDITDLGEVLEAACGMVIRFQVRTRDEYTNIDFIEPLEEEESEEETVEEAEEDEYTKEDIAKMSVDELDDLAADLDIDPDEYETYTALKKELFKELGL